MMMITAIIIIIIIIRLPSNLRPPANTCIYLRVVTSDHEIQMAGTPFNPP